MVKKKLTVKQKAIIKKAHKKLKLVIEAEEGREDRNDYLLEWYQHIREDIEKEILADALGD